jgi:hypothetical protein
MLKTTAGDSIDIATRHQGDRIDHLGDILMRVPADEGALNQFQPFDVLDSKSGVVGAAPLAFGRLQ